MADEQIEAVKAALRLRARAQRANFLKSSHPEAAAAAAGHFFSAVALEPHMVVAAYWPIRDELDCRPVLTRLMDSGQPVCLPVVLGDERAARAAAVGTGRAALSIRVRHARAARRLRRAPSPISSSCRFSASIGWARVSAMAAATTTARSRAFARRPRLIGFAFAAQELDFIPREPHDVPLDAVVTEQGVLQFAARAA